MKRLWAPWRLEYILGEKPDCCIFCAMPAEDKDRENYILYRGRENFVIMNRYPYNNGHLMVIPYRHADVLEDLSDGILAEAMALTRECCRIIRESMHAQGFNVGLNVGEAAGAGIKEHLHFHIVPRWAGDTNFMSVVEDTRIMPQHLTESYEQLLPGFEKLKP